MKQVIEENMKRNDKVNKERDWESPPSYGFVVNCSGATVCLW